MRKAPLKAAVCDLPVKQREALISLLADDDKGIYRAIRSDILSHGGGVVAWLEPYTLSEKPVLRRRTHEIIAHFQRQENDTDFSAFCLNHGEDLDLEEGLWQLARTQYPEINEAAYRAILDDYAHDLHGKLDFSATPEGLIAGINQFLFKKHGFTGDEDNYYNPENSYLNRVVDRRLGNPISLSMIYLGVCRRLKLPVTGIGLPGHFLCRLQDPRQEIYIDAFNQGRVLTKADCMKYLKQAGYEFHEAFLVPASPRRILLRMCSNLHQIYQREGKKNHACRLQGYIVALSK